jgi:hypothetical protein
MVSDPSNILKRCIDPLDLDTFFSGYWEKKPLIIPRSQPGYFSNLLSLEAVDTILTSTNLRVPGFRLVRQGSQIPIREYTTRVSMTPSAFDELIDADKVYALYQEGATIVLQSLDRSWGPLIEFCKSLEAYLGHPVQANMYLTPANAQGFAAHHDTHDTLILQVEGHKHWKLYDMPIPLPLPRQDTLPPGVEPGPVQNDFVLNAGDTLYMPRGVIHEALTSDSYSMHITVGIKVWTWADALARLVSRALDACEQEVAFRRALPLRFTEADEAALARGLGPLLESFKDHLRADGMAEMLVEEFVTSRWAYRKGQLVDLHRLENLSLDSVLCRRGHAIARLSSAGELVALSFQGKRITFPAHALEAVRFVIQHEQFRVGEIPDVLDEAGKLVLVKRLVREGLLTLVEESGAR